MKKKDWKFFVGLAIAVTVVLLISFYQLSIVKPELSSMETIGTVCVTILLLVVVVGLSTLLYYKKNITEEKAFLYTIPVICILFLIFMPTFKSHDESSHWNRAYEVSTGKLVTSMIDGAPQTELPESIATIVGDWREIDYAKIIETLKVELNPEITTKSLYMSTTAVYSPVQYFAQAFGIAISRFITNSPLIMAYAARLCNLILSVTLLYFAIKKMPFGKKVFLVLAYIPVMIEGFASMSPDGITISVCYLFIAYIMNLSFSQEKKKVQTKDMVLLGIMAFVIALCKIVYLPLIGLLLIIPKDRFQNMKTKVIAVGIIWLIAVVANLSWLGFSSQYLETFRDGEPTQQTQKVLTHPIEYAKTLLYTFENRGQKYLVSLFGGEVGWDELIKMNFLVPYTLCFMFLLVPVLDNSIKDKFNTFQKVIIGLVVLAIVGLVFTSLYIQWTSVESDIIEGVQGRYFLPFIPLVGLLIGTMKVKSSYQEQNMTKCISIIGLVLQIQFMLTIYIQQI